MSFEVHREPLYRRYYASLFSGSCCYAIAFGFILIFLPLIIAYNSSDFWIKEDVVYEQPRVSYRYQTLVQLHGSRAGLPFSLFYSTSPTINKLHSTELRMPLFHSAEQDDNRDGRTDRIEINMQMPLAPYEEVYSFTAIVYCDSTVNMRAKYTIDALSFANYESRSPIAQLSLDGDLLFRQTWPLTVKGGYRLPYANDPLIDLSLDTSAEDVSISKIMQRYNARNFSMVYSKNYEMVERTVNVVPSDNSSILYFNASMVIRIPAQPIRYTPAVSSVLKHAWIQYLSFFVVVAFLLFRLNSFVFRHKLLYTYTTADIVYEKLD